MWTSKSLSIIPCRITCKTEFKGKTFTKFCESPVMRKSNNIFLQNFKERSHGTENIFQSFSSPERKHFDIAINGRVRRNASGNYDGDGKSEGVGRGGRGRWLTWEMQPIGKRWTRGRKRAQTAESSVTFALDPVLTSTLPEHLMFEK